MVTYDLQLPTGFVGKAQSLLMNPNSVKLGQIEVRVGVELGLKLKVKLEVFEPP
jgi:hypothetical protein